MSSEERQQILKMVEDGKISADEAMKLMKALDELSVEMEIIEAFSRPLLHPDRKRNQIQRSPTRLNLKKSRAGRVDSGKSHCGSV